MRPIRQTGTCSEACSTRRAPCAMSHGRPVARKTTEPLSMVTLRLEAPGRLALASMESPVAPGAGEALVRIHRVGVCGTDLHAFGGRQPFFPTQGSSGHELGVEVLERKRGGNGCRRRPAAPSSRISTVESASRAAGKAELLRSAQGPWGPHGWRNAGAVAGSCAQTPPVELSFDQLALVETLGIGFAMRSIGLGLTAMSMPW